MSGFSESTLIISKVPFMLPVGVARGQAEVYSYTSPGLKTGVSPTTPAPLHKGHQISNHATCEMSTTTCMSRNVQYCQDCMHLVSPNDTAVGSLHAHEPVSMHA